jgi:hypothetical protein
MKKTMLILLLVGLLLAGFSAQLRDRLAVNLDALDTLHILHNGSPLLSARPAWLSESRACAAHWMATLQADAQDRLQERDQAFQLAAACDPQYVALMQRMHTDDLSLAQIALASQPGSAESWFWAGDLLPEKKIEYYQKGLAIEAWDGKRWLSLGDALQSKDIEQAMQAYLNACKNGDPGYHGCARAGSMAEQLGLYQKAIEFYRLSAYPRVREKADALEGQLTPTP